MVGIEAVSFNLSHSADVAALAISATRVVDVEIYARSSDEIERALSIAERLELAEAADALQLETFFRFWTLKEAFMKGTGLGASLPLHDFDVSPAGPGLLRLKSAPTEPGRWRFDEFVPKPGIRAALAARTDDRDLVVQWRWADFE
jgi:4'-phosphopantetheinyl transferase